MAEIVAVLRLSLASQHALNPMPLLGNILYVPFHLVQKNLRIRQISRQALPPALDQARLIKQGKRGSCCRSSNARFLMPGNQQHASSYNRASGQQMRPILLGRSAGR